MGKSEQLDEVGSPRWSCVPLRLLGRAEHCDRGCFHCFCWKELVATCTGCGEGLLADKVSAGFSSRACHQTMIDGQGRTLKSTVHEHVRAVLSE
ncbi:hypothetical protein SRHO_G00134000 [Serrasalmus rhombeus]